MALGRINFADLNLLLWDAVAHFLPMQDYLKGYDKAIYSSVHAVGIVSGCQVTPVSGMTVRVAAGLVLFSNGELCEVAQQDVTLSAADGSQPRIDRLQLTFTFANNATVTTTINQVKQFDKVATGTAAQLAGTPGVSPTIPVKTAGAISLGSVSIAAGQTTIGTVDISQGDDVRDRSYKLQQKFTASIPQDSGGFIDVKDLILDKNKFKQYWIKYQLARKTDTGSSGKVCSGTIHAFLNPETNNWDFSDDRKGNDSEDMLVEFNVVPASGKVQWDVDSIAGANHVGTFTANLETLDV